MKRFVFPIAFSIAFLSALPLYSTAQGSTKDALESIIQTEEIATFFEGVFDNLGIILEDSGEKLTLRHDGDHIHVEEGMDPHEVDFVLPLKKENIKNLMDFTNDGAFTEYEATRIARIFFTPFTRETLKSEVMSNARKRKAAGIEDLIHVKLMYAEGTAAAEHTLIYAANQWVVIDGLHGDPKRTFTLTQAPALTYQRMIFKAIKTDTKKGWLDFLKWYKDWRKEVSVTH